MRDGTRARHDLSDSALPTTIDWSGLAGIDNAFTVSPDDPDLEGANSFDNHRIYLTGGVDVPTTCE